MHVLSYSRACLIPHTIWKMTKETWPEFEPVLTMFLAFKMMALHLLPSGPQWFLKLGRLILSFSDFYIEIINGVEITKTIQRRTRKSCPLAFAIKREPAMITVFSRESRREAERESASQCQRKGGRSALISGCWTGEAGIKLTRSGHPYDGFGKA